jgi:hypothetical protein
VNPDARKLYVSFHRRGSTNYGSAVVPLLGPLSEYALEHVARAVAEQVGAFPKEITIIAITKLEE